MTEIIGIAGRKRAGKTSLAEWLTERHGFAEVSFAKPLKNMLDQLFYDLGVGIEECNPLYHAKDEPHPKLFGLTPRFFMQTLGTEWGRHIVHPDLWVEIAMRDIKQSNYPRVVISDVRFRNEVNAIHDRGGSVIWIENNEIDLSDDHTSERSIERSDADHIITNNFSSAETFCRTASEYVLQLLEEKR